MTGMEWYRHSFEFPRLSEPEWSLKVERWYQLDAAAFALAETFWRHRASLKQRPEWLLLASPLASNVTDAQFALSATASPAKFVHTLPNIRGASLLQVMDWSGQVLCLQNDPTTVTTAISEGMQMVKTTGRETWVLSVTGHEKEFTGHIFALRPSVDCCTWKIGEITGQAMPNSLSRDKDLFFWLNGSEHSERPFVAPHCELYKCRA